MNFLHKLGMISAAACLTGLVSVPADAAPREVRIASHVSELAPLHAQSVLFAKTVDERLPGRFDFKIFPNGQLGKESALIDNLQLGTLEMINVASGVLKIDGKLGIFDLPWLFDNRAHVIRAMEAGLEDAIRERVENSGTLKVIGVYENGFRHVINSRRPIVTPSDIEGLKVRISGGKFRQDVFASMGAIPTKVAWGETFSAMQTGVVDGAEAAAYGFYGQRHYEVMDYLSKTSHVYTPSFLMASSSFFDSLTDEEKQVFVEVGHEITAQTYEDAAMLEAKYLEEMGANLAVNDADITAFQKKTAGVTDDYVGKHGSEWLDLVNKTRASN